MRRLHIDIDYNAIEKNYALAKKCAPNSKVMAIIKANAYGHGLFEVANTLSYADAFGVATPSEAIALRKAGVKNRILVLEGFLTAEELSSIQEAQCDTVVHSEFQVELLKKTETSNPIGIWLKVDSGMHRLGIKPHVVETLRAQIAEHPTCKELVLMTHLASSEELASDTTAKQLETFQTCTELSQHPSSTANSAAILSRPETHGDWVRAGIMLYGASPLEAHGDDHCGLTAAMEVTAPIIAIRDCEKGDAIGYGGRYTCPTDMRIGVVAIGYGDGYPRHAKDGTPVLINGDRVPMVGRVSMDMITVDLTDCKNAAVGDHALLWGKALPVEEVAQSADTISYELLCQIQSR